MSDPNYTPPDLTLLGEAHVRAYQATDGAEGYLWNGVHILLLTTTGHRSGKPRTVPLIFGRDGERLLVIASKGGAPAHPHWYTNLAAQPDVTVQVQADRGPYVASTAESAERERLWAIMVEQWPNYDAYQSRTDRQIPVVVLTPRGSADR